MSRRPLCSVFACLLVAAATAQDPRQDKPTREYAWATGKVEVEGGYATIDLPDGWRYLQSKDARYVVEQEWGNPPDPSTLGLVVPPGDADWAIIVSYEDSGHVDDADATGLDYAALLADMQADAKESNAARKKAGYPTVDLLGWAESPHYDGAAKKLYWAKKLQFAGSEQPTLNYDVRILAAGGVLVMSAVANVRDLAAVGSGIKSLLPATALRQGHRYQDFSPGVHKVAAYGIGGLIAGKLLAKAGLFKLLLKPLLLVGAIAVAAAAKLLGRKKAAAASGRARSRESRRHA